MESTPANLVLLTLSQSAIAFYALPHVFPNWSLTFLILVFSFVTLFEYGIYRLVVYPLFLDPLRHFPTARGFKPIVGHVFTLLQRPPGNAHLQIMKTTPNDGIIRTWSFFHSSRLLLTSPEALADVLVHNSYDFEKPPWTRDFLRKFLGDGLFISEGEQHKHDRKQIMPAFHFRHIKGLYPLFWSKSVELCENIKLSLAEQKTGRIELSHCATQVTLDIIGIAGLGRDIGSLRDSDDELIKYYEEILEPTKEKMIYFVLHLMFPPGPIAMLPWKINERVKITTTNLRRICKEFVIEKKSKMKRESEAHRDILSIMIQSNNFSDDNLADQLLTFLAAGHETTSSQLTFASYLLSKHSDAQSRLRAEIYKHIPDPNAMFASSADISAILENMPYLNAVCNEALRLYPAAPVTSRVAIRDTTVLGHHIPKHTMLFAVPWATNRNPDLWGPDSEDFVPERWIDKETGRTTMNGGASSNFSFLTFLHGPHSCIGEKFARAELRVLLATIIGNFEMEMADPLAETKVVGILTLKAKDGMHLKMKSLVWG